MLWMGVQDRDWYREVLRKREGLKSERPTPYWTPPPPRFETREACAMRQAWNRLIDGAVLLALGGLAVMLVLVRTVLRWGPGHELSTR